ncbi:MAG: PAS domain S-box protein [Bacteroidetes bacterium]|nr:PAS domain S-box protein [Bacteroidota bacterium]
MKTAMINIENLKKQRENIFFSSHTILFILNIDLDDIVKQVNYIEKNFTDIEFIGKNLISLFPVENHQQIKQIHERVKKDIKQAFYESNFVDNHGQIRLVNVRILPIIEEQLLTGLTILINDITESKNAIISYDQYEENFIKNESEFRLAFNELLIGVVIHDRNTQIVYSNNQASKILRLSSEQMLGKIAIDKEWMFVYENMEPVLVDDYPVNKVLQSKSSISNYTLGIKHAKNEPITWVNANATPFFDIKDNSIEKIIVNFVDITEQKHAQDSLRRSESNLSNIINNIGDPVFVKDKNNVLLIVNDAFCKLFGLSREDIIGKSLAEDVSEEERINFLRIDKEVLLTGVENITEEFLTVRKGETLTISTRKTRYIDNEGNKFIIGVMRDITEAKKAHIALIESQRLGAIGEMTSSIAHDFNNSLQAIYGNIELAMAENDISETTKYYLDTIKKMVNDTAFRVQLLQRFGGNKIIKNKVSKINLNNLIEEVILQSRPIWKEEIEKKGLSITITTQFTSLSEISGNDADLRSAFFNIIKNSVEAMPKGGNITIQTTEKEDKIFISISDNGIGMNDQIKARIFQPFYTTKGYEQGRGLGMSGVYSIVKEHDGEIYVKHTIQGVGSTIEMVLPINNENEDHQLHLSENETKEHPKPEIKKQLNILWVDDNDAIRTNASLMLDMMGHQTHTASSGKQAIQLMQSNQYDVVFSDIGMPEMNGWQLAEYISEQFNQSITVIIVSGWGAEINEEQSKKHNVLSVISKPFDMNQIESILNSIT